MRKRKVFIVVALVTALFLVMDTTAVFAAKSLSEIRKEINETQKKLSEGQSAEDDLANQVYALEEQLANLEIAIAEGEEELEVLEKELAEAQAKVDEQSENLGGRLRNMYKNGTVGFMDVLLDSGSFSEFLTNLDLVKKIYSADQAVMDDLQAAHDEVNTKKTEVETLQAELEESKKVTEEQKATVEAKKAEMAKSNEELTRMLNNLQADADKLTAELQGATGGGVYVGGELAWPTPSTTWITSPFGYRSDPFGSGSTGFHSGIDIGAGGGKAIVAANSGRVYSAGWNGGYGKCVIIDHGGGMTTLYGHCSSLLVSKGQYVSRGQQIAKVGTTGWSTGNHLHFEVRINGAYKNPMNYF